MCAPRTWMVGRTVCADFAGRYPKSGREPGRGGRNRGLLEWVGCWSWLLGDRLTGGEGTDQGGKEGCEGKGMEAGLTVNGGCGRFPRPVHMRGCSEAA